MPQQKAVANPSRIVEAVSPARWVAAGLGAGAWQTQVALIRQFVTVSARPGSPASGSDSALQASFSNGKPPTASGTGRESAAARRLIS